MDNRATFCFKSTQPERLLLYLRNLLKSKELQVEHYSGYTVLNNHFTKSQNSIVRYPISSSLMKVLKFGGTSVGSVESIKQVIQILEKNISNGERTAVVFSAMGGATNRLIEIGRMAAAGNQEYFELLKVVEERHFATIRGLINVKQQSSTFASVKGLFNELEDILRGVSLIRELTDRTLDLIMSFGERLSTTIITEALKNRNLKAEFCDARRVVRTNSHFGMAEVDFPVTNRLILEHFAKTSALQCITGFISADSEGITTTLGRGGSDYTASIFGAALDAQVIEIWSDVDGMMTADPRKVPNAFTIPVHFVRRGHGAVALWGQGHLSAQLAACFCQEYSAESSQYLQYRF